MTKASHARKARKGKVAPKLPLRSLTEAELSELQELHRLAAGARITADLVAQNTALVPDGQEKAKYLDAVARLLENYRNQYVNRKITECGYDATDHMQVSLKTGEIAVKPKMPKA